MQKSALSSCTKSQMCFLATYCKQYWKAGLSAFINYNSSCNMEFLMKIEGTKWFFWQCANLIISSLKLFVCPKCSLHLSFWTNQRENGLFLPWFYWILRIQKNHSFFSFLLPSFLCYIYLQDMKAKSQNHHYHEFVYEVGQLLAEFLGMSSSFVLKSRPALPNLAQT